MTREELKEHCKKQIEMCEMWAKAKGENPCGKVYEEHKLILELLKQQPCTDVVSRQAVLDQAVDYGSKTYLIPVNSVKSLPPVTPAERTAYWINKTLIYKGETKGERDCYVGTCSACGTVQECWKFCCGCGARMVSE